MPEQISTRWDAIKQAIKESLPPISLESPNTMNNILIKLMNGDMVCWISHNEEDEVKGFIITRIITDDCSETKSLLLYIIYGSSKTKGADWVEGYQSLKKYALSKGCVNMIGYTKNEKLIKIADKFSSDSTYRFVSFPI